MSKAKVLMAKLIDGKLVEQSQMPKKLLELVLEQFTDLTGVQVDARIGQGVEIGLGADRVVFRPPIGGPAGEKAATNLPAGLASNQAMQTVSNPNDPSSFQGAVVIVVDMVTKEEADMAV